MKTTIHVVSKTKGKYEYRTDYGARVSKGAITSIFLQEIKSTAYSWYSLHQHDSPLTYIVSKGMVHGLQISSIVLICSGECLTKDLGSG
jgi:hypothetical protein